MKTLGIRIVYVSVVDRITCLSLSTSVSSLFEIHVETCVMQEKVEKRLSLHFFDTTGPKICPE